MSRRPAGTVAAAVLGSAGCAAVPQACPAVDWGSALVVRLGDGWADGPDRTAPVACPDGCGNAPDDSLGTTADDGSATFTWVGGAEDVVVTVSGPGEHAEVATDLVWQQVGGTAECGGPMEATVTVPAP